MNNDKQEAQQRYKKPARPPEYLFNLDYWYFVIENKTILVYKKQRKKEN